MQRSEQLQLLFLWPKEISPERRHLDSIETESARRYFEPTGDEVRRLGFLEGQLRVPADFDHMGAEEIATQFESDT